MLTSRPTTQGVPFKQNKVLISDFIHHARGLPGVRVAVDQEECPPVDGDGLSHLEVLWPEKVARCGPPAPLAGHSMALDEHALNGAS